MPTLFLSHGAPTLLTDPGDTGAAWRNFGLNLPKPSAVLMISAHWESDMPVVSSTAQPATLYDFSGFPAELYQFKYPAPGAPDLANRVTQMLQQAGITAQLDNSRGLDHGAWVPMRFLFPDADVPVTQLSLQPMRDPSWHFALGRALKNLREQNVLIIGSGSITHNLRAIFQHRQGDPVPQWMTEFRDWVAEKIALGDMASLVNYRTLAPHAEKNHPTDEHLLPLFVALGAASEGGASQHLNQVLTYGFLAMDAWVFG